MEQNLLSFLADHLFIHQLTHTKQGRRAMNTKPTQDSISSHQTVPKKKEEEEKNPQMVSPLNLSNMNVNKFLTVINSLAAGHFN